MQERTRLEAAIATIKRLRAAIYDNVVLIEMIETIEGVKNAREIAAIPGVTGVFAASGDLGNFSGYKQGTPDYERLINAVHDAARPLVTPDQIERVFACARENGAAALAAPVTDTLKRAGEDRLVTGGVPRDNLYAMETPQIFARDLLEDYLENPEAVPTEWRQLFESGRSDVVAAHPGLARLLETVGNGHPQTEAPAAAQSGPEPAEPAPAAQPSDELLGAVAAAMALVKAHRMHGHLAAHLDPLGSEPPGDPALEPERLIPKLTPELQARIPAGVLRLYVPGETLAEALPRLS